MNADENESGSALLRAHPSPSLAKDSFASVTQGAASSSAAPASVATGAPRVAALDGLRGVAILLVLAVHYYANVPTPEGSAVHDWLRGACSLGYAGVDLFFVLSGYLIGGILIDHRTAPRLLPAFYARRFFRIVPIYAVLLATFFIARATPGFSSVNHGTFFWSSIPTWSFFGFVQNVAMAWQRDIGPYWLGPTWSLAVEEQFYLIMPFLVSRLAPPRLVHLCVAVVVLSPLLRYLAIAQADNGLAAVFLLPTRADGLLCGVLCASVARTEAAVDFVRRHRRSLDPLLIVLAGAFVAASFLRLGSESLLMAAAGYSLLALFFSAALLRVVVFPHGGLARALQFRPLTFIGITSYFTYLFHTPIWYTLHWILLHRPPLHWSIGAGAVTLLALGVTLAAAWLSWRWFEGPLLRAAKRFSYA